MCISMAYIYACIEVYAVIEKIYKIPFNLIYYYPYESTTMTEIEKAILWV